MLAKEELFLGGRQSYEIVTGAVQCDEDKKQSSTINIFHG
jgi:hypothetical protein